MTPDPAHRLVAAYPDIWARGMRIVAHDEQATEEGPQTGTVVRITERGDVEVCWDGFEFGERPGPTLLPTDDPEWGTPTLYAIPALDDPATAGVLVARLCEWFAPAIWQDADGEAWNIADDPLACTDRYATAWRAPTLGHAAALALLALRGEG